MILTIALIIPAVITIIILSYFMKKSIARKEWNTVWLQGINIVNALIIISFILQVYFTIN
jgi:chromate transport protein ChrA